MHLLRVIISSLILGSSIAHPGNNGKQALAKKSPAAGYALKEPPLTTPWTDKVGTNPWPEYPRPQLQRSKWQNLNGVWQYQNASSIDAVQNPPFGQSLGQEVLIPSCLESGLSGELSILYATPQLQTDRVSTGIQGSYMLYSWFSTSFNVPSNWGGQRVVLNFGAVDYEATVFVNGKQAGFNRGGYFRFSLDVTHYLNPGQENEL